MTNKFVVGDRVYVSRERAGLDLNSPSAYFTSEIKEIIDRSAKLVLPNGENSNLIPTSALTNHLGILVIRIGDYESENDLLNPLRDSLMDFFRLLLAEDEVMFWEIRHPKELETFWTMNDKHKLISHIILIGHGKENAIRFGNNWIDPKRINDILNVDGVSPKQFISLCCKTGISEFGKEFSKLPICSSFIAPFQSVHGATASLFCQIYFTYLLLHGITEGVAFKHAKKATPKKSFRMWKNGRMMHNKLGT